MNEAEPCNNKNAPSTVSARSNTVDGKVNLEHRLIVGQPRQNVGQKARMDAGKVHEAGGLALQPEFVKLVEQIRVQAMEMLEAGRLRAQVVEVRLGRAVRQQRVGHGREIDADDGEGVAERRVHGVGEDVAGGRVVLVGKVEQVFQAEHAHACGRRERKIHENCSFAAG